MKHAVVVEDPAGELLEGEILSGNAIGVAQARDVVLLPVEYDLLRRGGVSGWSKRAYGRGWRYDAVSATRGCPLVLHVAADFPLIEWKARLQGEPGGPTAGSLVTGSLRMASDTAAAGGGALGMAPETASVQLQLLEAPDAGGGWIIGGRSRAMIPGDMFLTLQLYGLVDGARVVWFAASQTR